MAETLAPDRPAEGAGEMGDGGIDGDDEIELLDHARGVGEVLQVPAQIAEDRGAAGLDDVGDARPLLQAVEGDPWIAHERQETVEQAADERADD